MPTQRDWHIVAATCGMALAAIFVAPLLILLSLFVREEAPE